MGILLLKTLSLHRCICRNPAAECVPLRFQSFLSNSKNNTKNSSFCFGARESSYQVQCYDQYYWIFYRATGYVYVRGRISFMNIYISRRHTFMKLPKRVVKKHSCCYYSIANSTRRKQKENCKMTSNPMTQAQPLHVLILQFPCSFPNLLQSLLFCSNINQCRFLVKKRTKVNGTLMMSIALLYFLSVWSN